MPDADPLVTRAVSAEELDTFFRVLTAAFGEDATDVDVEIERITAEPERTLAVFDGPDLVATAGAFTFDLTVAGGSVPTGGVTYVGVRPTHRRRGILRDLMRRQLSDIHDRGEPLAALWASEAAIYGRFGYGLAAQRQRIELDRIDARLRDDLPADDCRLRQVPPADAVAVIEQVERAVVGNRPGDFVRDKRWIEILVQDPESRRSGMSSLQCVVASRDDEAVGYALYRTKPATQRPYMLPDGELFVVAHTAVDPAATVALARLLLSVDLMRRVTWWNLPVDTAIPHLLQNPRHARTTVLDALWVRVVDVPAALTARTYEVDVDVVVEVVDELCPWNDGRWRLRAAGEDRTCERTDADPHLRMTAEALGAVYLGGTALQTLAAAGRVKVYDDRASGRLGSALRSAVAPWCPTVF